MWLQGSLPTRLGSALLGRDSHSRDDFSEFHEVISQSFLTSRVWSLSAADVLVGTWTDDEPSLGVTRDRNGLTLQGA